MNKMAENHNFRIKAITIDEGIPGYRNEALEIVEKFCENLNVGLNTYSFKELFELTLDEALDLRENEKTSSCSICGYLWDFTEKSNGICSKRYWCRCNSYWS
jgi:tRNA(Ile)-lysidine synthase TilS/MesJ